MVSKTYKFCPQCTSELVRPDTGYIHCSNQACNFVLYENPTPVVAAIVEDPSTRELILVQSVGWPSTWFALVTGFLEKHEDPNEAVLREVQEEIGLDGELISFVGHYPFRRMNQIIMAYHIQVSGEVKLGDELADYRRVSVDKVRTWDSGTGYALRDWLLTQGRTDVEMIQLR
ncbi:MAG: NUDIX hydrolase [Bacteroidota bacterium]